MRALRTPPFGILVQGIEGGRAVATELELGVGRLLRVLDELPLQVAPAALAPRPLDLPLQLPQLALVSVHVCSEGKTRLQVRLHVVISGTCPGNRPSAGRRPAGS